jgi:large subunit ribosomal protein L18Ae
MRLRRHSYYWTFSPKTVIIVIIQLREVDPFNVKNYGIWIRYDSTTGTHNMFKEYRDLTLCGAVDQLYEELAGRHRVRPRSMQIMRTAIIGDDQVKRASLLQFMGDSVKFPLPHRIPRAPCKRLRPKFLANRPSTYKK